MANSETLFQKLKYVQQNGQSIPQNGWNNYSGYAYPLWSDIMDTLTPLLNEKNLFLYFTVKEYEASRSDDGKKALAKLSMRATVVDCDNNETLYIDCPGYSEDSSDKAVYQTITNCRKYATLCLFGLRVGTDQEASSTAGARGASKQGKAKSQQSKAPEPVI